MAKLIRRGDKPVEPLFDVDAIEKSLAAANKLDNALQKVSNDRNTAIVDSFLSISDNKLYEYKEGVIQKISNGEMKQNEIIGLINKFHNIGGYSAYFIGSVFNVIDKLIMNRSEEFKGFKTFKDWFNFNSDNFTFTLKAAYHYKSIVEQIPKDTAESLGYAKSLELLRVKDEEVRKEIIKNINEDITVSELSGKIDSVLGQKKEESANKSKDLEKKIARSVNISNKVNGNKVIIEASNKDDAELINDYLLSKDLEIKRYIYNNRK